MYAAVRASVATCMDEHRNPSPSSFVIGSADQAGARSIDRVRGARVRVCLWLHAWLRAHAWRARVGPTRHETTGTLQARWNVYAPWCITWSSSDTDWQLISFWQLGFRLWLLPEKIQYTVTLSFIFNNGATLAAGWGGRPSYQWCRPRPRNPLFFLSFGYRATEERPLCRKKTTGAEQERAASTDYRRRRCLVLLGSGN